MKNVKFKPWVGKDYHDGNEFGKKILVIGESHYCEDCEIVKMSTNQIARILRKISSKS